MAHKTPILITYDSPSAFGAHGPMRAHPRKNLLSQMHRRAAGNARRMIRDVRRSLVAIDEKPNDKWTVKALRKYAAAHGVSHTTKTTKGGLLARIRCTK